MKKMTSKKRTFFALALLSGLIWSCASPSADLVVMNAKILTLDPDFPEAGALAVSGDRIVHVGSNRSVEAYIDSSTTVLDLDGRLVIPGLIESHAHFMSYGYALLNLDLTRARQFQDIVDSVASAARRSGPGEWIIGRGWHQEKWNPPPSQMVKGYPVNTELSRVAPDNPVYLTHVTGHAVMVNRKALEIAGITAATGDPEGGTILRFDDGSPTGILLENAADLVYGELDYDEEDDVSENRRRKAFDLAVRDCIRNGITTFHDAGSSFSMVDFFKSMADEGALPIRLWVMLGESNASLRQRLSDYRMIGYGNNHLTVRSIKRFVDGALGSHGAWFFEPYLDMPGSYGLAATPLDEIRETAEIAILNDMQLCTHAIGDRGNKEMLDVYQETFERFPQKSDLRWRIEHAQHLRREDIPRFAHLGVIASMQTNHATSDGPFVIKRLGEERAEEGAYVWKKLMDSGALIANGTDAPVEDINPMKNFYSAVTRKMANGETFFPDQCMSRTEALQSYTLNGAIAGFEEHLKGSLSNGKLADITVLSKDIMEVPAEEIPDTEVLYTIIGGNIVFQKQ